jgi:hypothetical protein
VDDEENQPEAELTAEEIEAARREAERWVQHIWTHTRTLALRDRRLLYAVLGIDPHTGAMTKATSMPEVARREKMGARAIEFRLQAVVKENPEVRKALEALDRLGEE